MSGNFFNEFWANFKQPWKFTAFLLYFFLIVLLIGGIDIYISIYQQFKCNWAEPSEIAENMAAFSLTIIAASIIDVSLNFNIKNKASFHILAIFTALFAGFLFFLAYYIETAFAIFPAFLGVIIGLSVWVIANHDNLKLRDENFYQEMKGEGHGDSWGKN